ncbi:Planctomycete cytochrome C [Crateriforma conspicua]|uniref:Planctomycete cytochrome C n=1 Tax=Crateriforma conspicua TaxID=2527996 RepID=A0A5C6FSE9_9PLAN|nr:Planctomycete cytochrome C [Crateriforma conspicua]
MSRLTRNSTDRWRGGQLFLCLVLAIIGCFSAGRVQGSDDPRADFFESKVRPLLISKCHACHSAANDDPAAGLMLDSADAIEESGAVIAGQADDSLLIEAVSYESGLDMPPDQPLSDQERAVLRKWIDDGAFFPDTKPVSGFDLAGRRDSHWAWQPVNPPEIPATGTTASDPIDAFVQRSNGPHDGVDRATWLRRVTFALTGLPPTPDQLEEFLADQRPDAKYRWVNRQMADPEFGVRWGRHWMDLVRFAETYGHEFDYPIPHAWRFRDWVVRSINEDVPFDQFVVEQLAGDLVPSPRRDPVDQTNLSKQGSAFWWLGEAVHAPVDVKDDQAIRVDNQIDVAGKAVLGLTIACARCHDHKFDAISQADYYSLSGILQSTTRSIGWLDPDGKVQQRVDECRRSLDQLQTVAFANADLGRLEKAEVSNPPSDLPNDAELVFDLTQGWPDGCTTEGWAFEPFETDAITPAVTPSIVPTPDGDSVAIETHPAGWLDSRVAGVEAAGVWRSPPFVIKQPHLIYQLAGQDQCEIRLVVDGYFMGDYHTLLFSGMRIKVDQPSAGDDGHWGWQVQGGDLHHYIGHTAHLEVWDPGPGWVGLARVYQSAEAKKPDSSVAPVQLFDAKSVFASQARPDQWDSILQTARSRVYRSGGPRAVPVLQSSKLTGRDVPLAVRGDVHQPGDPVPRSDLTAFRIAEGQEEKGSQSGPIDRLELARRWTDPANPLTPRVAVNRWWHHVFGQGIVASCDNFGVLGQMPSDPDLLDHLADRLMRGDWSRKRMVRDFVLSDAFADPSRIQRLEGEAIRDALLTISGRLDRRIGGPSVPIHLTSFMTGRGRPRSSGPIDGQGRRSLFVEVRRNFLSPFMAAFDTPAPSTSVGKRNVSNVPAQALAMLNDPMIDDLLDHWIQTLMKGGPVDDSSATGRLIDSVYMQAFARKPTEQEFAVAEQFLVESESVAVGLRDFVDVLVNTKEFIFVP